MNTRKFLLAANIALAVGGASFLGYVGYDVHKQNRAREERVVQMVQRFHGCPDRFNASRECFDENQRREIFQSAERAEREHRWEDSAREYARLTTSPEDPMEIKAREMAGNCSEDVRRRIGEEIAMRHEAIRRASLESAPSGSAQATARPDASAPASSASAQPVDAGVDPAPDAEAPADAAQRMVTITFRTQPSGVEVLLGEESRCTAAPECSVEFTPGTFGLEFSFRKQGYRPASRSVTPDQDQTVEVTLEQERQRRTSGPGRRTPRPPAERPPPDPGIISSPD